MPLDGWVFTAPDGRVWDLLAGTRTDPNGTVTVEANWSAAEKATAAQWRKVAARNQLKVDLADGIAALKDARSAARTIADTPFNAAAAYSEAQLQGLANAAGNLADKTAVALTACIRLAQIVTDLVENGT